MRPCQGLGAGPIPAVRSSLKEGPMTLLDVIAVVELVFLVLIWWDGRVMKSHSAENVGIQRQQLEHQKEYLTLRRKWYEQRSKKKIVVVPGSSENPGSNT